MTNIRDLLDEATRDVVTDPRDATERVRRGLRARRRNAAAIAAVVAVVVAAIVVPLSLTSRSTSLRPSNRHPKPPPVLTRWTADADTAASGFGKIWALHTCDSIGCKSWVDELDPATGRQIARIDVQSPSRQLATGAGVVWVLGVNPGGGSPAITVVNPSTHATSEIRLNSDRAEPHDIAFADNSAWITFPLQNKVERFSQIDPASKSEWSDLGIDTISLAGTPTEIATTGDGQIWVRRVGPKKLTEIAPLAEYSSVIPRLRVVRSVSWGSRIFSATSPPKILFALGAGATVGTLAPAFLDGCLACAQGGGVFAKGRVNAVLETSRGWWVATAKRTYFYDRKSLRSGGQPTASTSVAGASISPDGNGIVIGDPNVGLFRWTPRAR